MELKVGDVVYLNSNPEVKFTIVSHIPGGFTILGYNKDKQEFVTLHKIPEQALTLVNNPSK